MSNGVPPACQNLAAEVNRLQTLINTLQKQVWGPNGLNKGAAQEIAALGRQLAPLQTELTQCLINNGVPQPLTATLNGTAFFFTGTPAGLGLGIAMISIALYFGVPDHIDMRMLSFLQTTTMPFSVPGLPWPVATTLIGRPTQDGIFSHGNGEMSQPLFLDLTTRIATGPFTGMTVDDSTTFVLLTTGSTSPPDGNPTFSTAGSPMDAAGSIGLVGAGGYGTGMFSGNDCLLTIMGVISPQP